MSVFKKLMVGACSVWAFCTVAASQAHAEFIIDIEQVGGNVVATGSGTINLAGLTGGNFAGVGTGIQPDAAEIAIGAGTIGNAYSGLTGPTSFGPGGFTGPNFREVSGDPFFLSGTGTQLLFVPGDYLSGARLADQMIFDDTTLAALGLTDGAYTWSWGSQAAGDTDSFVLNVGPATAVPEPASLAILGAGLAGFGWMRRRRGTGRP